MLAIDYSSRHISRVSSSWIPQLWYVHTHIAGRTMVITRCRISECSQFVFLKLLNETLTNLPTTLCLKGLQLKKKKKMKTAEEYWKRTMPMCNAPCTFKAILIDNTFDWGTDCVGCLTWTHSFFFFFTFCVWLVSQEDVETTSDCFYFPMCIIGLLY